MLAAQVQFVQPNETGAAPVHLPTATGAQITKENQQFLAYHREFTLYTSIEAKLKQQILQVVPPAYTNAFKERFIGFAHVLTLDILIYLHNDYGKITTQTSWISTRRN
jgi:hypothetical protein